MGRLDIDFDGLAATIADDNASEARSLLSDIRSMRARGMDCDSIISSLPGYAADRLRRVAMLSRLPLEAVVMRDEGYDVAGMAKAATRTGYQERAQFACLRDQSRTLEDIEDLPNAGPSAVHLPGVAKSVDFIGHVRGVSGRVYTAYFAAKYTDAEGGAQDNQRHDLESFASVAPDLDAPDDSIIVLLADGPHYRRPRGCYDGLDFYRFMSREHPDRRLVATDTAEFDDSMSSLLSRL